jgi:Domain of unknown function (DUF4189)
MRRVILPLIGLAASFLAASAQAIDVSSDSYAAIAYSPSTGKIGYSYDRRSRAAAEDAALKDCGADDATIACWVNRGFCALALGNDKSCWGSGWRYGDGAKSEAAKQQALDDCRNRTTGAHVALVLSSDGQYKWDYRDNTTIIDKNGNVYDGYGRLIKPSPGASSSPSASPSNSDSKK